MTNPAPKMKVIRSHFLDEWNRFVEIDEWRIFHRGVMYTLSRQETGFDLDSSGIGYQLRTTIDETDARRAIKRAKQLIHEHVERQIEYAEAPTLYT